MALPIIYSIKVIDLKKFTVIMLNKHDNTFVIHIAVVEALKWLK